MSFDLTYKIQLSDESKAIYDKFISDNKEKKEVDYADVFELMARAAAAFSSLTLANKKPLGSDQQRQLLGLLFDTLVKDELNDFKADPRIASVIDTVMKLRDGEFEIDLGSQGGGCFPCCSSVKISARK